jgi:hypothetical protein
MADRSSTARFSTLAPARCSGHIAQVHDVGSGSKAPFWQPAGRFRSTLVNRQAQSSSACRKGAMSPRPNRLSTRPPYPAACDHE